MYHIKHKGDDNLPRNRKLLAKKSSIAHQHAPIDYISPWEAQHHIHLIQSHVNQNNHSKIKSSQQMIKVNNVVNLFLQKVRRTKKNQQKNKIVKNFSIDQQQKSTSNNSYATTPNTFSNTPIVRKIKRQSLMKSQTYDGPDFQKQKADIEGVRDVGFGLLKYSKQNLHKQQTNFLTQNDETKNKLQLYSPMRKFSQFKKSPSFYCYTQKEQQKFYESKADKFEDDIVFFKNQKLMNSRKRIFTEQQLQKPQQIVFVKKKKQNNKMAVIDINQTAQQFYDEEIKYIENTLFRKYGKKAKSQISRNQKFLTQEEAAYNQSLFRTAISRGQMRNKMNRTGYVNSILSKRKII